MKAVDFRRRFVRSRPAVIGSVILLLLFVIAGAASFLFADPPLAMVGMPFAWPGEVKGFPLGTDMMGRNITAGIFYGARISLLIGFSATIISVALGVSIGAVAGYLGGIIDDVLMRVTELFQTLPAFILAIVFVTIMQPSITSITIAIGVTSWPTIARLVRAEAIRVRNAEYVQNATLVGMSDLRIVVTHIVPNALTPVIVASSILVATAILTEAGLAFLGLGDPNVATWGGMIGSGRDVLRSAWYMTAIPGIAIMIAVMGFNLLGDGLNDILNPREVQQ